MSEDRAAGATPADQGATPEETSEAAGATPEAAATATAADGDATPATGDEALGEAGLRALRSTRAELGIARSALSAANERIAELEGQVNGLTTAARAQSLRSAVTAEAARRGFRDPEDAVTYLAGAAIEYDADGNPTNVGELVETLATSKAYLLTGGRLVGGPWGGAEGGANEPASPSFNDMIRAAAGRSVTTPSG